MSEQRKYPKSGSRQIIDYDNIVNRLGEKGIYCIDKGILSLCAYFVGSRGLWPTSYAVDRGDITYGIPNDAEFRPISEAIADFLDKGVIDMSCDIVAAIDRLSAKIICGGMGLSVVKVGETEYYGSQAPLSAPTTFGGTDDQFGTEQEYNNHRCLAATSIVNAIYSNLSVLGSISTFQFIVSAGLTVAVLSGVLALPLMPLIIALSALGLSTGLLIALRDEIDYDELKCQIYNSDGAISAYEAIETNLTEVGVSLWGVGVTADLIVDLVMSMANIDILNNIFKQFTYFDDGLYDCSGCVTSGMVYAPFAVLAYGGLGTYQNINSINDNNPAWGNLTFNQDGYVEFGPFGSNVITGVRIWAAEPSGGLQSVVADSVQVRGDGIFEGSDPNGSYPTDFMFDNDVAGPDVIRVTFDILGGDKPIYEVQFWYRE